MKDWIIFQQDNDPKHTSKKALEFLHLQELCVLDWPPQSPDLNPIEHLWGELKKSTADHPDPPVGMLELWGRAQKAWAGLPPSACLPLVRSMPRRLKAELGRRGDLRSIKFWSFWFGKGEVRQSFGQKKIISKK